jgi:hypothetical protein
MTFTKNPNKLLEGQQYSKVSLSQDLYQSIPTFCGISDSAPSETADSFFSLGERSHCFISDKNDSV